MIPDASPFLLFRCSFSFASVTHTLLFKYGHLSKINGKPTYLHISTHGSLSCPEVAAFDLQVAELVIRSLMVTGFLVCLCACVWRGGPRAEEWQGTRVEGRGRGSREESGMLSLLCAKERARAGIQGNGK